MQQEMSKWSLVKNIVIVLAITMIPFQMLMFLEQKFQQPYFSSIVYLIAILFVFCVIKFTGRPQCLSLRTAQIGMFFSEGWYILVASFILGIINFLSVRFTYLPSASKVVFFFVETVLGVVFEELLFRGVIQNKIVEFYEEHQKSVWSALCISSLIFTSVHLLNLIGKPYFILGTFTQVIYTFSLGLLIGCVYWHSKNIWTACLLHLIFNILGSYSTLFYVQADTHTDIAFIGAVIQIVLMLPCIFFAHRIYRKSKMACIT